MGDDITLAAEWGGGARGGPAQPPHSPPRSKRRGQNPAIIILEVYNLKPNNVWGASFFCYHESIAFSNRKLC